MHQFGLSFVAISFEYMFRNFGRKPRTYVNTHNASARFGPASISVLGDHGYVLGGECNF